MKGGMMSKRFEVLFYGDVINCVRDENGKEYNLHELINLLMDQQATIKDLERKLQICSAHLLSDECCLTDGQIRKIIKEMENE